jgi:glutamyl/glutaminyl-tRNA synthetase
MSKYIPPSAVARETYQQVNRRIFIETKNKEKITLLKELLKTEPTIIPQLRELGLTKKHAENLEQRLQYVNQMEEKIKGEKEPVVDPKAIQQAAQVKVDGAPLGNEQAGIPPEAPRGD